MQVQKRFNFTVVALANLLISFLISTRSAFVERFLCFTRVMTLNNKNNVYINSDVFFFRE